MAHVQMKVAATTQTLLVVDDRPENLAAMEALLDEGIPVLPLPLQVIFLLRLLIMLIVIFIVKN